FDAGALWVMQAWSMREDIVKAVPKESLLILDLNGLKTAANGGWVYPVIAGNLHNFGGRINMHGVLALLASNQYKKAKARYPNVCGSGLFMEAIEQYPVYYELAF
ncbi:alpha-N-acetylglucosaminidase TIM-barrel domain-containing protein, partial [Bacteroides cellulosilyticus]